MGIQQKARVEAHKVKLHAALTKSAGDAFPVNLKWMVDLFFYKHISSLTTHLKRHFREDVDYTRRPDGRRSWSYHITLSCFVKICKYARHAKRQAVSKQWMKILSRTARGDLIEARIPKSSRAQVGTSGECEDVHLDCAGDIEDEESVPSAVDSGEEAGDSEGEEEGESEDVSPSSEDVDSGIEENIEEASGASVSRIPEHLYTSLISQSPTIAIPFLSDWSYLRLVPLPLAASPFPTQSTPTRVFNQQLLQQQQLLLQQQQQQLQQQQPMQRFQAYKSGNNYYLSNSGNYYVSNNSKLVLRPAVSIPTHLRHHVRNSVGESEECDALDNSFDTNVFLSLDDE